MDGFIKELLDANEKCTDMSMYNEDGLDPDIIYNYLARGLRTPKNETERLLAEEGKRLKAQGGYEMWFN